MAAEIAFERRGIEGPALEPVFARAEPTGWTAGADARPGKPAHKTTPNG
jgi:hypothetical protein